MMKTTYYRIETLAGIVVRRKATRPYKAGWIPRDANLDILKNGQPYGFTINPRTLYFTTDSLSDGNVAVFEPLIAVPIVKKSKQ